ncbi:hypothetical protein B0J18DRAFT_75414 [Chaetomium sp. MPI-SDFR-AT-0129]|nr:hypothetical protein B0J18DRAFT_75414 [Chaetomium sp. MPI-SDFR-AT-0129]
MYIGHTMMAYVFFLISWTWSPKVSNHVHILERAHYGIITLDCSLHPHPNGTHSVSPSSHPRLVGNRFFLSRLRQRVSINLNLLDEAGNGPRLISQGVLDRSGPRSQRR